MLSDCRPRTVPAPHLTLSMPTLLFHTRQYFPLPHFPFWLTSIDLNQSPISVNMRISVFEHRTLVTRSRSRPPVSSFRVLFGYCFSYTVLLKRMVFYCSSSYVRFQFVPLVRIPPLFNVSRPTASSNASVLKSYSPIHRLLTAFTSPSWSSI